MSENRLTNVKLNETQNGSVSFASDVIATIAGLAATEVEGVASKLGSGLGLVDMLRKNQSNRALAKGVKIETEGTKVVCHINVTVEYGIPVPQIARDIQENVKHAIENMTGLEVTEIDVYVQGISFEKENKAVAELEERQHAALNAGSDDKADADTDTEKRRFKLSEALGIRRGEDKQDTEADGGKSAEAAQPAGAQAEGAETNDASSETTAK